MDIEFLTNDQERSKFLEENWNKKHLFIKKGIKNIYALDHETINELLMHEDIESRVVIQKKIRELEHGPFSQKQINEYNKDKHTFIVHNLNHLFPEINLFEQHFNFLPNWLFDDVMATYSNKGSSIGAHFDPYNVVIIQARGIRKWQLQYNFNPDLDENNEVKVLNEFQAEHEFELHPGDVLFIPKECAHRGETIEESLSYSVGFKAIQIDKLVKLFLSQTIMDETEKFLDIKQMGHHINSEIFNSFKDELTKLINNESDLKSFMASQLSASKYSDNEYVKESFKINELYSRCPDLKWAYYKDQDKIRLCVNEVPFLLDKDEFLFAQSLLKKSPFETFQLENSTIKANKSLLDSFLSYGFLEITES